MQGGAIWRAQVHVEQVQVQSGGGRPAAAPVRSREAEKLQLWSPVISRVIVPVICPQVSHGTKPRSCETLFYVPGPAGLIYLHKSTSNATRVDLVFITVTSMHHA